ncbi:MAG: calcium/sodium antiporter [Bacilli bacterium]
MIFNVVFLILGFIFLIKGADIFIDGASNIAKNLKLSKMLIGLTIVSIGTSAPEFAISCKAILAGNGSIVLGNVIGSNIINILLIIGISAIICPIKVKSTTLKNELPLLVMITSLLVILLKDNLFNENIQNVITRIDGIAIIIFMMVFVKYLLSIIKSKEKEQPNHTIIKSVFLTILGIIGILIGSDIVVNNAVIIAESFNISDRLISLTIIALGTSAPELASAISAALKNEHEILIGNIIGSNIFNIGLVLGVPVALFKDIVPVGFSNIDIIVLLASTLLLFLFGMNKKISKKEGIIMLLLFVAYYTFIILKGVII